eukprot:gnl/Ergobibamus_cyprinoides/929.p1 GENE.gnl/Ergobibamus_cyprinoides/929~~gnl/Ergobibamus_cyprinoides/929.p1  ORF type:complete len:266 (+),score=68.76 gnl/Ergobibamus_cyprinoides/929:37-834(+)
MKLSSVISLVALAGRAVALKTIMPWMCLERCGENITADLAQIDAHRDAISIVSFEAYDVADDGSLKWNSFTDVFPALQRRGLETYPMITTVSWPRLHALFANPQPFISAAIDAAVARGYTGYNLDFEPTGGSDADGDAYVAFLKTFAAQAFAAGVKLQVDWAQWNLSFWHLDALAAVEGIEFITMDTYCTKDSTFESRVKNAISHFAPEQLSFGLETDNATYTTTQIASRLELISETGSNRLGLWQMPVPESWWPALDSWVADAY